jgi:hypothetical protein
MLVPVAVNHVRAPEPAGGAGHERARRAERGHRADASSRVPARRLCSSRVAGVAVPVSGYASDFSTDLDTAVKGSQASGNCARPDKRR